MRKSLLTDTISNDYGFSNSMQMVQNYKTQKVLLQGLLFFVECS